MGRQRNSFLGRQTIKTLCLWVIQDVACLFQAITVNPPLLSLPEVPHSGFKAAKINIFILTKDQITMCDMKRQSLIGMNPQRLEINFSSDLQGISLSFSSLFWFYRPAVFSDAAGNCFHQKAMITECYLQYEQFGRPSSESVCPTVETWGCNMAGPMI